MKGDAGVIQRLNAALINELTAINQYFLHSRMLNDWGLTKLGALEYQESIEEMQHADKLIARILFLEGLPNLQDLHRLKIGENVKEILEADLALELEGIPPLREAVAYCEANNDYGSRDLFAMILKDEEHHVDLLETQLSAIEKMGIENYTQTQYELTEAE